MCGGRLQDRPAFTGPHGHTGLVKKRGGVRESGGGAGAPSAAGRLGPSPIASTPPRWFPSSCRKNKVLLRGRRRSPRVPALWTERWRRTKPSRRPIRELQPATACHHTHFLFPNNINMMSRTTNTHRAAANAAAATYTP